MRRRFPRTATCTARRRKCARASPSCAACCAPGAPIYITLGSIHDERFGFGEALDEWTFAPGDGPEMGIPHAYFDRDTIVELLRGFTIESLEEVDARTIVGTWAHTGADEPPGASTHWFVSRDAKAT